MKLNLAVILAVVGLTLIVMSFTGFKTPPQSVKVAPSLWLEPQVSFSPAKTPQYVEVSPALKLELQASFPPPEAGLLVYMSDGLWFYDYGWKKVKFE